MWGWCLRAPIPEALFFVNFSMWLCQSSLSSIITPSDFVALTLLTWLLFILIVGEVVKVFSLCLDPISMNSVLVMFNASLFACSQSKTSARSSFRQNWTFSKLLLAYVKCVSSAYILGLQFDKQFGRSLIYNKNNRGGSLEGDSMSMSSYWKATRSQSIFVCVFQNMTETIWKICDVYHNSLVSIEGSDDQLCQKLFSNPEKWHHWCSCYQESVSSNKAVRVEWLPWNPDWLWHRISCSFK